MHSKWNVNQAIFSGVVMAFIAIDASSVAVRDFAESAQIFIKAAIDVCAGLQLDMDFEEIPCCNLDEIY